MRQACAPQRGQHALGNEVGKEVISMEMYDAIIVGSSHNALVTAAYLTRAGWSVLVLEKNDRPGGLVLLCCRVLDDCTRCARRVLSVRYLERDAGPVGLTYWPWPGIC